MHPLPISYSPAYLFLKRIQTNTLIIIFIIFNENLVYFNIKFLTIFNLLKLNIILDAFKMCIKHFGRLDIVVNNAGVFDASIDQWSTTVRVNYVSFNYSINYMTYYDNS